ncbi:hypothetical protein C3941_21640 [Kaistia algarum]|uniref:gamma-butyrobetaine hydroxylase-like domain-containing protein n=1 Tax=Kaistia algarum TaxID=2083279 RepID=UPI000CE89F11|nr:DUF971 domain-containing protein [Kaistia algarum]MCX5515323.1 DUF971 domain-containing protein [Kaistia algarum]PPE77878.1 hypothetical protein C3941_21640 [Kaistia algarum]
MSDNAPWPTEIRLSPDRRTLTVAFDDGSRHVFAAEFLRVVSPSAEVQGHNAAQRQTVPGKIDVVIEKIDPVGNYAVRLHFDDGHHTGLYSWIYLAEIGRDHNRLWQRYLDEIAEKGLKREAR